MEAHEDLPHSSMSGRRIGAYRLDEEIGRGGMGAVFRATRVDGEFDQTVAVKLIKRGMDTDMILRRFRRERQILASLNHPNIAHFLGGGSTEDGLPYFVMEFIDGFPLYKYCGKNALNTRERLLIFRQVCWAVAAAHESQIVHRDLKPSNIMVKWDGKPKLLDFGIAKVLDPDPSATDGEPTATQLRAMTPEYASPEQISGDAVGPASDIYSLGVILYELLTGHRPYSLRRNAPEEVARVIREQMPTNPSGSVTHERGLVPENGEHPSLERVAESRGTTPEELRRELVGDLDKIILKALRKEPEERYRTVMDLADDITNFLDGKPVNAEFFLTRSSISGTRSPASRSIAILPFKVLAPTGEAGDTGSEFVGIGLADALITRLSGVPRLVVRPTTSVLPFADATPPEAAAQLGVDYVLDGNVRLLGGRIRVSVQLYTAAEDRTEWARAFDEKTGDVLALEDSLAEQVSGSLLSQLTSEEKDRLGRRGTDRPEAYEAYLRGRYFWSRFSDEGLVRAVKEFERAIEIDPSYAQPYIGLADYYVWAAIFGEIPSTEGFPRAMAAAKKALEVNDLLGEAYAILGFAVLLYEWNWNDAELLLKRAIELNPNHSAAHEYYSNFLVSQGRLQEGVRSIKRAEELDPVSPRAILMTAWTLYQVRRFEEAERKARKALEISGHLPQAYLHLGNILIQTGSVDEAVEVLRKAAEGWGRSGLPRYMLAYARAAQGDTERVRVLLDKILETERTQYMKPYFVGMSAVAAGEIDTAFEWFRRAVEEHNEWMVWFPSDPKLDPIRGDKRYADLLKAIGVPASLMPGGGNSMPDTAERERTIAVVPFKVIGKDASEDYLSIGLADSVTMRLSNVRKFIVRPTSSVMQIARAETDPFAIAERLNAEFVVDGIIRYVGSQIRVTAQLLEAENNATRWSGSFQENMADVLELEDSIAEQVTRSLLPKLSGEEEARVAKRGTNSRDAHDAYLQGRFFWNQFTPDSFPKSIRAFERAVELDPEYALAYVGIADYYTWSTIYGLMPPGVSGPKVFEAAQRALELDPLLPEAHAAQGLYFSNRREFARAENCYRRSIELNPNYPLAHEWLSSVLVGTGRFEEGKQAVITSEQLNLLSLRSKVLSAWTIYQTQDFDLAAVRARELADLNPEFMQSHLQLANILHAMGRYEESAMHARRAIQIEPDSPLPVYPYVFAMTAIGENEEAQRVTELWTERGRSSYVPPYFIAMCIVGSGRFDQAFEFFEQSLAEFSPWMIWFGTEPKLNSLRDDPRYKDLLFRTRNPIFTKLFPDAEV